MKILKKHPLIKKIIIRLLIGLPIIIILLILFVWGVSHFSLLFDLSDKYNVGTALGGLTAPFIGIIGVILTFIAFYIQYVFNQQQTKIIEQQRISSIKQSFDPFFLMLLNQKNSFIYDNNNLSIVNDQIEITNKKSPTITTETTHSSFAHDGWRSGTMYLTYGIPKVKTSEQIFIKYLDLIVQQIIKHSDYTTEKIFTNKKFSIKDKSKIKIRPYDFKIIKSIVINKHDKAEYFNYISVYNRFISNIVHTIHNQQFDNDPELNKHLKQQYLSLLFTSSTPYESAYCLLYLATQHSKYMKNYFFDDKCNTAIDLLEIKETNLVYLLIAIQKYFEKTLFDT